MKKKFTRMAALSIALVLMASTFGACSKPAGGTNGTTAATTGGTQATTAAAVDPYAPIEGKVYQINYLTQGYETISPEASMVKFYNEKFNVKINPIFIEPSKWDDLLNIKLASNEIPDVWPSLSVDRMIRYQSQGLLAEVPRDVISKYAPNIDKAINRDAPDGWEVSTYQGKNYGIPYLNAGYMYRDAIAWRTDWLENVGITKIPDTIQEWEDALLKFRNNDPDKNGKKDTYGCSLSILAPVTASFGPMVSMWWDAAWSEENGTVSYDAVNPKMKDSLALLARWYKMEILDPEFVTGENKGGYWAVSTDFVNGRIGLSAMGSCYHWDKKKVASDGTVLINSGAQEEEFLKKFPNGKYDFGNPPLGTDGKTRGMTINGIVPGSSYIFSVNLNSEKDKLGKLLQMFDWVEADPQNWVKNMYGEEGVQYNVKNVDGYKILERVVKKDDQLFKRDMDSVGQFFIQADVENYKLAFPVANEYYTKNGFTQYGKVSILNKLVMPSYSKVMTDLSKLMTEAYVNIITGKKPVDSFDDFVAQWKAAGGEQLLKEANDSYKNVK